MSRVVAVHPKENLLKRVVRHVVQNLMEEGTPTVIFPHRRPIAFFERYLQSEIKRPLLLTPKLSSFEDWVREVAILSQSDPEIPLGELDQGWLAYKAAREVLKEEKSLAWNSFFPWARRLVGLFKELDLELCSPEDLSHPPQGLPEMAAMLLERIGTIFERFNYLLKKDGFTTHPKQVRWLAEGRDELPEGPFLLVGFYALTKAEDALFRRLFKNRETTIYWHSDPHQLPALHREWKERWGVEVERVSPEERGETRIHLFEAYDLHSELKELEQRLSAEDVSEPDKVAVVLPSREPLIPLLHHLPEGKVNVTMGYPFRMTGLYLFLESLFEAIATKDPERGYSTPALVQFLKSPYLGTGQVATLLYSYQSPFIKRAEVESLIKSAPDQSDGEELEKVVEKAFGLLEELENVETFKDLAGFLEGVLEERSLELSVADREVAAALLTQLVLPMKHLLFSEEQMEPKAIFSLFLEMLTTLTLPLEGEPLEGLQVMGLLESRLLSFEKVFALEVNEGVLPKVEEVNPLITHEARVALGLPLRLREEEIFRYHFRRLLDSAQEAHIFWQLQTTPSGEGGLEGKKVRSRFVEELVWEREKARKEMVSETPDLIKKTQFTVLPAGSKPQLPSKTPEMRDSLSGVLTMVSPSLLNTYLRCPLQFLYNRVLGLQTPRLEGVEPPPHSLGSVVHATLKRFYLELAGQNLPADIPSASLNLERLMEIFEEELKKETFYNLLSAPRKRVLLETSRIRFGRYLKKQGSTRIEALEKNYFLPFNLSHTLQITFRGILDRVDLRDGLYLVLDYKTGSFSKPKAEKVMALETEEENELDQEGLQTIYQYLSDLQLPFYVYLFGKHKGLSFERLSAGCIGLGGDGEEFYIVEPKVLRGEVKKKVHLASQWAQWMEEEFPSLLRYLLRHILDAPLWYPATHERVCGYCDYRGMCRYAL